MPNFPAISKAFLNEKQLYMKTYYTVIISGSNIFFENYNDTDPVVGFIARRVIQAESEEMATATAKRDILVNWNHSFNADRRMGLPNLHLEFVSPFNGWRIPRIKHDYYWFTDDTQKFSLLEAARKPVKRWIWF